MSLKGIGLKDAIRSAAQEQKRQDDQKDVKLQDQIAVIPEYHTEEEPVNLTIRVTKRQRRHWGIEAKKRDTSLTAAIIEALNARFGEPVDAREPSDG